MQKNIKTAVAIFVKTPGLSPLKTRLAAGIGNTAAQEIYNHCVKVLTQTLGDLTGMVYPIWAVGEKDGLKHPLWSSFENMHTGEGDLGDRQKNVYTQLLDRFQNVILIGADTPQISAMHFEQTIKHLETNPYVFGPANDGGYYLFGGCRQFDKNIWDKVPWSAENTLKVFQNLLAGKPELLAPLTDIDTLDDLDPILSQMPKNTNKAQDALIKYIKDFLAVRSA